MVKESKNQIGEKIDIVSIASHCRDLDANTTRKQLVAGGLNKVWSWGAHKWLMFGNKAMRFTVNGYHFSGHIYIFLNGSDLYDIYYCSNRGTIKMIDTDIFCEDLTNVIDRKIEYISEYGNR